MQIITPNNSRKSTCSTSLKHLDEERMTRQWRERGGGWLTVADGGRSCVCGLRPVVFVCVPETSSLWVVQRINPRDSQSTTSNSYTISEYLRSQVRNATRKCKDVIASGGIEIGCFSEFQAKCCKSNTSSSSSYERIASASFRKNTQNNANNQALSMEFREHAYAFANPTFSTFSLL